MSSPSNLPPLDGAVLVVDDDSDILFTAELVLGERFAHVECLVDPTEIPARLQQRDFDVVVLDMNFSRGASSGEEGLHWLARVRDLAPATQVIATTAFGEVQLAVEAIKRGAYDFLMKPWEDQKLETTVIASFQLAQSQQRVARLEGAREVLEARIERDFSDIVGNSAAMNRVFELLNQVAGTDANVLVLGENGTGKELIARAIHRRSKRSGQPMISVDMGALPDTLFESEMFGHRKGAFTDAKQDRVGRFELASGSTLFLDEIGNLSSSAQGKLLGALERRQITRLGAERPVDIDIRLISATNVSQEELADGKRFRQDLLYRINTVEISLPALRERVEDIPLLVQHFIELLAPKYDKPAATVSEQAMQALVHYPWPGNVRELRHVVERALIVAPRAELQVEDLVLHPASSSQAKEADADYNLARIERQTIERALQHFGGNLTVAAKELGVGRTTLYRKLAKYGLSD